MRELQKGDVVIVLRDRAQEYDYSTIPPPGAGSNGDRPYRLMPGDCSRVWYLRKYEGDREVIDGRFCKSDQELIGQAHPKSGDVLIKVPGVDGQSFRFVNAEGCEECYTAFDNDFMGYCRSIATILYCKGAKNVEVVWSEDLRESSSGAMEVTAKAGMQFGAGAEGKLPIGGEKKVAKGELDAGWKASVDYLKEQEEACRKKIEGAFNFTEVINGPAPKDKIEIMIADYGLNEDKFFKGIIDQLEHREQVRASNDRAEGCIRRFFLCLWRRLFGRNRNDISKVSSQPSELRYKINYNGWDKCRDGLKIAFDYQSSLKGKGSVAGMVSAKVNCSSSAEFKMSSETKALRNLARSVSIRIGF